MTTGYQFTMRRACGHEETVTLYGNQERRNEQRRRARVEVCAECAQEKETFAVGGKPYVIINGELVPR